MGQGVAAAASAPKPTTKFDNWKAITHAKEWCSKAENPCGVYLSGTNKSDCAHFLAHTIHAGGIRIADGAGTGLCPQGLAVRNQELVSALRSMAQTYSNVSEIGLTDAIVGDLGFLDIPPISRPWHAFMICEPVDLRKVPPPPVKVWAHSTSRCAEPMDAQWKQWFSTLFRITDAS